jgi:hypothetical protein
MGAWAPEQRKLTSAVHFIQAVAAGRGNRDEADAWLQTNGYECELTRKLARERRAAELDKEIERLRAERARL